MNTPQIIVIALWAMGLGIELVENGKPKTGKHSFWIQLISVVITASLLIWGGFFN